jgi:hypothetical protein
VRRKVFRIEQTLAVGRTPTSTARPMNGAAMRDMSAPQPAGKEPCMTRAAGELGAAVEGMEIAVQTILQSAEVIDDCARALAVAHRNSHERKLAEDVQDHLTRIYEACNFQDIAGQRIGKVIETLSVAHGAPGRTNGNGVDHEASRERADHPGHLLNGPRLDGEPGSVSQHDIDSMFSQVLLGRPTDYGEAGQRDRGEAGGDRQRRRVGCALDRERHNQRCHGLHDQEGAGEPAHQPPVT